MIPDKLHRRLRWALSLYDWGYKTDAFNMLEKIARYVTTAPATVLPVEESEVKEDGIETREESEEEECYGRKSFGFGFCI